MNPTIPKNIYCKVTEEQVIAKYGYVARYILLALAKQKRIPRMKKTEKANSKWLYDQHALLNYISFAGVCYPEKVLSCFTTSQIKKARHVCSYYYLAKPQSKFLNDVQTARVHLGVQHTAICIAIFQYEIDKRIP